MRALELLLPLKSEGCFKPYNISSRVVTTPSWLVSRLSYSRETVLLVLPELPEVLAVLLVLDFVDVLLPESEPLRLLVPVEVLPSMTSVAAWLELLAALMLPDARNWASIFALPVEDSTA
jgi:hypothetical protein